MSYPNQVIGNQGGARPTPEAQGQQYYQQAPSRNFMHSSGFPGGNSYGNYPGLMDSQLPSVQTNNFLQPQQAGGGNPLASLFGGGGNGGGGGFSIDKIKNVIDRLGGVEGIVDTFQKMQRMVQGIQQVAPMLKLLAGSFGKGKAALAAGAVDEAGGRKKRRKRRSPAGRRRTTRRY
ncbi:hypothetical protein [Paenibacillus cremeus]|uniref:Tyrosine protein kinase n=1 Tax=Paenibacillus cremeus TaxID=2163881 RepID=A0A559K959_9BACL|nr:hypothetical protein [Paenibacillus cremeus]TVY08666.1 hypothetical protein FPZ49_17750 [Paenibacillus cremeus]